MPDKFSLEQMFQIWDDGTGECIEVGPDRDGLGLIEIRYRLANGQIGNRIVMPKEQARLVVRALTYLSGSPESGV